MRTDTGQVFKLEDYRPSDYLTPFIHGFMEHHSYRLFLYYISTIDCKY